MLKKVLKDERGLSLVELLAVVVIMAIIAGIGAVAISNVIQKNREDAGVANVQTLLSAARLYEASPSEEGSISKGQVTAQTLVDNNYLTQATYLKEPGKVKFSMNNQAVISVELPAGSLKAGGTDSQPKTISEEEVSALNRDDLFKEKP
ncbi:hypothetical protein DOK67_0001772 [Enterococcus sp. DIV0212c]|uniref:pilus assembly FimT family protein n=1 Tax=Enterococcus sp. DIV0212c TaxID=2230867 RepID=UPI001A9BC8D3|nr:prepilin-type N-terminal cleavage/methylation domain-containing protein [Enterococcus sp. DIV0212c]MBO1353828.1 prepilin-type N-terminal cleavage/methylation domain-containing protein [Enterococcus sp. DIV0212c]